MSRVTTGIAAKLVPTEGARSISRAICIGIFGTFVAAGAGSAPADSAKLQAEAGVTALSGIVLDTNGKPLQNVMIIDDPVRTSTDIQGQFLLAYAPSGDTVLTIDGRHTGASLAADHGIYKVRVSVKPGVTTSLPFTSYLPLIDHSHDVAIASPTTREIVIKTSGQKSVEVHIPAGVTILDADGKAVTSLSIITYPAGRAPFPLPARLDEAGNFTIQPGGSCIMARNGKPGSAQIWYPNTRNALPRSRETLYRYDVAGLGWTPYGIATMSADKTHFVPDENTVLHDFDGQCPPHASLVDLSRHFVMPSNLQPGKQ